jgi:allantoin racemase
MQDVVPLAVIGTGTGPGLTLSPPPQIVEVAAAGFRPGLVDPRRLVFPGTLFEHALTALCHIDAGIEAYRAGYKGVFINTVGDYGIDALRSALPIPVVGAGEAAITVARTLGRSFAIVTIWPRSLSYIPEERVKACGAQAQCVGILNVMQEAELEPIKTGAPVDAVVAMHEGRAGVIGRVVDAAQRAIRDLGADVIVLGCTCMAPIASAIAARVSVPVVEPMRTGYKYLEMLATLSLAQSKATYPAPDEDRLGLAEAAALSLPVRGAAEECEVCLVVDEV